MVWACTTPGLGNRPGWPGELSLGLSSWPDNPLAFFSNFSCQRPGCMSSSGKRFPEQAVRRVASRPTNLLKSRVFAADVGRVQPAATRPRVAPALRSARTPAGGASASSPQRCRAANRGAAPRKPHVHSTPVGAGGTPSPCRRSSALRPIARKRAPTLKRPLRFSRAAATHGSTNGQGSPWSTT